MAVVQALIGQPCWSAMGSTRTDWVVVLDCGERRRRSMRLSNPRLSFLQRTFEGEYSLLIECVWRIDGPGAVVASCFDSNQPGGLRQRGLAQLEGRVVEDVTIAHVGWDLTVHFTGGYVLRCLSTEVEPDRKRCNWSMWSPGGLVTAGPRGLLQIESSRDAELRHEALKRSLADEEGTIPLVPRSDGGPRSGPAAEGPLRTVTGPGRERGEGRAPPDRRELPSPITRLPGAGPKRVPDGAGKLPGAVPGGAGGGGDDQPPRTARDRTRASAGAASSGRSRARGAGTRTSRSSRSGHDEAGPEGSSVARTQRSGASARAAKVGRPDGGAGTEAGPARRKGGRATAPRLVPASPKRPLAPGPGTGKKKPRTPPKARTRAPGAPRRRR